MWRPQSEFVGLCQEVSEVKATGMLTISNDQQTVRFVNFADDVPMFARDSIQVLAEDGRHVALLDCVSQGCEQRSGGTKRIVASRYAVNKAIIGQVPWDPSSKISSVHFTFDGAREAMYSWRHVEHKHTESNGVGEAEGETYATIVHLDRLKQFELKTGAIKIESRLATDSRLSALDISGRFVPVLSVTFEEPRALEAFLHDALLVVWFFTLSIGRYGAPRDVHVGVRSARGSVDSDERAENQENSYEVRQLWARPANRDIARYHYAVFHLDEEDAVQNCKGCLALWFERSKEWAAAYSHGSASLAMQGTVDGDRLLTAFAWFESIPTTEYIAGPLGADATSTITEAALEKAREIGCASSCNLIRSALGKLKSPSVADKVAARIGALRTKFGDELVPSRIDGSAQMAIKLRGKLVHGNVHEDLPFPQLADAIFAMELICFLSLYLDLPIRHGAITRGHPCMHYLLSPGQ